MVYAYYNCVSLKCITALQLFQIFYLYQGLKPDFQDSAQKYF